jgi:hypothetical protein
MTAHLTGEQISKWIAGAGSSEMEAHVRECAQCGAVLASFGTSIMAFRDSVNRWADKQNRPLAALRQTRKWSLRWAAVAAAMAILAAIPAYKRSVENERAPATVEESQLDAQLLERVNSHLSRSAPASLQPLTEMFLTGNDSKKEGERK